MCLAVPGEVISMSGVDLMRTGEVRFGAMTKIVNLGLVPEAKQGNYVLVHAGVAISVINEAEAQAMLRQLESLEETS